MMVVGADCILCPNVATMTTISDPMAPLMVNPAAIVGLPRAQRKLMIDVTMMTARVIPVFVTTSSMVIARSWSGANTMGCGGVRWNVWFLSITHWCSCFFSDPRTGFVLVKAMCSPKNVTTLTGLPSGKPLDMFFLRKHNVVLIEELYHTNVYSPGFLLTMIENIDDILYKTREVLNTRPHFSINIFYSLIDSVVQLSEEIRMQR